MKIYFFVNSCLDFQSEILNKSNEKQVVEAVGAFEFEADRLTRFFRVQVARFDCRVDRVGGHRSIGRPLAAGDCDETAIAHLDDVIARDGLGVFRVWIVDERADSTPRSQDVAATN